MLKWWKNISEIGLYDDLIFAEKKRVCILNRITVVFSAIVLVYLIYDLSFLPAKSQTQLNLFLITHLSAILLFIPVLFLNHLKQYNASRVIFFIVLFLAVFINTYLKGDPYRTDAYFIILCVFTFILFNNYKFLIPAYLLSSIAYYIVSSHIISNHSSLSAVAIGLEARVLVLFILLFLINHIIHNENDNYQKKLLDVNRKLLLSHEELTKSNFTKDKIFSLISHDLRSPIISLQGMLSLYKEGLFSKDEAQKYVETIQKQLDQLNINLEDLLTWSRMNIQGIKTEAEYINLAPVLLEIVSLAKQRANAKQIIIEYEIAPNVRVYCDRNMLKSIITNLISNALKFTPSGGQINIYASQQDEVTQIIIKDTGLGISKSNIDKLLNSNHFTTRGTDNEKGTGLGIAMSKDFIEKNKGKMEISSEEGKGSTFKVLLPASA